MKIKNGRIIINEDTMEFDIKYLEKQLKDFFKNDKRFSMHNIDVIVDFCDECWNETTSNFWCELNIEITNYDKIHVLGGQLKGQTRPAFANICYISEGYEPTLVMDNGVPEFYYVFHGASWTITNSGTWENNKDNITVEDIVGQLLEERFGV